MKQIVIFTIFFSVFGSVYSQQRDCFNVISTTEWDKLYMDFDLKYDFDLMETVVFDSPLRPAYNNYLIFSHYQGGALIATLVSWEENTATVIRKFQGDLRTFDFNAEAIASLFLYPSDNIIGSIIYALKEDK
jgi:hypothetical protein